MSVAYCSSSIPATSFLLIFSIVMHQSWGNTLATKVPHLVVAKSPGCLGATKNKDKLTPTHCSELVVDVLEAKCHYCSSKPCLLFGPFEHKSLQQRRIVQCKKVNCEATIVDLTLHGQLHIFRFRRVANLLALRAALMPLVRVPWCHNCSSKLCLQVGTCETRSPQLMQLCKNYKFGTASFQLPSSTTSTTATRYRACAGKKSEAAKL